MSDDPMRREYRDLTEDEKLRVSSVKSHGAMLLNSIDGLEGREFSIARTKIEEAVMWAVKGITK